MTASSMPVKAEVVRLLREATGDAGFQEIRAEFLGGTPGVFAAMRLAVDADDAPTLQRLAAGASARGERARVDALAADFDGVRRALEAF